MEIYDSLEEGFLATTKYKEVKEDKSTIRRLKIAVKNGEQEVNIYVQREMAIFELAIKETTIVAKHVEIGWVLVKYNYFTTDKAAGIYRVTATKVFSENRVKLFLVGKHNIPERKKISLRHTLFLDIDDDARIYCFTNQAQIVVDYKIC